MRIQVDTGSRLDQSGDTIFALSNDIQKAVLIKQAVRDECLERLAGSKLQRELKLFAACVYLLIYDELPKIKELVIDQEYPGHNHEIRWILLNFLKRDFPSYSLPISFTRVGKKSAAHATAYRTLRGQRLPDKVLSAQEILAVLLR